MRCEACDERLTPKEASRKFLYSGTYTGLCSTCLETIRDMAPTEDDDVRQAPPDSEENESQPEGELFDESGKG